MCLSTVYIDSNGQLKKVMQDVARMEARDDGFLLVDLFGEEVFIQGELKSMDFAEGRSILKVTFFEASP